MMHDISDTYMSLQSTVAAGDGGTATLKELKSRLPRLPRLPRVTCGYWAQVTRGYRQVTGNWGQVTGYLGR